jgi:2,3,4,5-tetrahydropyridine-2,6-dicarboxylate N-succinyltransferase
MDADVDELERVILAARDDDTDDALRGAVTEVYRRLTDGRLRVAEPSPEGWTVHAWIPRAITLGFRLFPAVRYDDGVSSYYDRIPPRFRGFDADDFRAAGVRVSPGAVVRHGAHVAPNAILMPSFVNVGAYVGPGTMVDTWSTVGSCVQIGANVHVSGGVGLGGMLEPAQVRPVIIEDECFIGARSEIVEGVIVERGSVIGMGVYIGASTPIYDRQTDEIHHGRVPAGSVVVSGVLNRGSYGLNAAIIVKQVDERTRQKTGVTALLRGL